MSKEAIKRIVLYFIAILIGSIGAIGQGYMLHHELADCYPYKIVNWSFYNNIAILGMCFAPISGIGFGIFLSLKRFWLMTVIPVILCPLLFSTIFIIYSLLRAEENIEWSFDGQTIATAMIGFIFYSVTLSVVGFIVGGICSNILKRLSVSNKLR
jgi:hypothetical protein